MLFCTFFLLFVQSRTYSRITNNIGTSGHNWINSCFFFRLVLSQLCRIEFHNQFSAADSFVVMVLLLLLATATTLSLLVFLFGTKGAPYSPANNAIQTGHSRRKQEL